MAFSHFGLIRRQLLCVTHFGPLFQHGFGLVQTSQVFLTQTDFMRWVKAVRPLALFAVGSQGHQCCDFLAQVGLQFQRSGIADCLAFGGICMNLATVQTDVAQLQETRRLGHEQHLHKEFLDFGQKAAPECIDGVMVRVQSASLCR